LTNVALEELPGYAFLNAAISGVKALVSRTGYTGEDGFELMLAAESAEGVWNTLTHSATPCGLGARDTLRTEAGFALYGHDIDETTNPYEARLGWVVSLSKPGQDFVGRDALAAIKASAPARKLVGLRIEPGGVPRPGFAILHENRHVGSLTTGTFSPTLKHNIAMGYVPSELSNTGQLLSIEMRGRGKLVGAELVPLPFVPHRSRPRAKM
jgi:aminomethyltransferase